MGLVTVLGRIAIALLLLTVQLMTPCRFFDAAPEVDPVVETAETMDSESDDEGESLGLIAAATGHEVKAALSRTPRETGTRLEARGPQVDRPPNA